MNGERAQPSAAGPEAAAESEADLRALFSRTRPQGPPFDLQTILAAAAITGARPAGWRRWGLMGVAAALLLSVGLGGGWLAGRHAAASGTAQFNSALESLRSDIRRELVVALQRSGEAASQAQRDGLKRVAILLRDDYQARLAGVESQIDALATAVQTVSEREPAMPARSLNSSRQ